MAESRLLPWLDQARKTDAGELREAVQCFVLAYGVGMDETLVRDLSPFPSYHRDTARLVLRDRINDALRSMRIHVHIGDNMALRIGLTGPCSEEERRNFDAWNGLMQETPPATDDRIYKSCARCGAAFSPGRRTAEYCSTNCRVAAYQARKRERVDT